MTILPVSQKNPTMTIETWGALSMALFRFSELSEDESRWHPDDPEVNETAEKIQRLAVPWEVYAEAARRFGAPPDDPAVKEFYEWAVDRSLAVVDIKRWLAEKGIPTYRREGGRLVQTTFPTN